MNVDARCVSRDPLDERGNHQEIHIVDRRDDEAPHALRRVEFFASADQTPNVAKDGLDRINQRQRTVRWHHAGGRLDQQRIVQLLP